MNDVMEYLLRATTVWSVLLLFYLVVRSRTGFGFQRLVLLGGWLFGLVVPLLPSFGAERMLPVVANLPSIQLTKTVVAVGNVPEAAEASWQLIDVLPMVYVFGLLLFGARTLVRWWGIKQGWSSGRRSTFAGFPVYRSPAVDGPFAAFGCVFMPAHGSDADLTYTALLHETAHLRARHHYDTTLLTLTSILLWFHPLAWVYRRLLAAVHEYQADAAVLQSVPARDYGRQLLYAAQGPARQTGLFSSPLKKRIDMMMNTSPKRTFRLLPILAFVLLLGGLTVACSDLGQETASPSEAPLTETVTGPETMPSATNREGGYYADTDDLQISMEAYLKDINQTIRYPAEARKSGTTGKFRAHLRLGLDGKIEMLDITEFTTEKAEGPPMSPEVVVVGYASDEPTGKKVPELLSAEINRTLLELENFTPLLISGVPTKQTLYADINFKLED